MHIGIVVITESKLPWFYGPHVDYKSLTTISPADSTCPKVVVVTCTTHTA